MTWWGRSENVMFKSYQKLIWMSPGRSRDIWGCLENVSGTFRTLWGLRPRSINQYFSTPIYNYYFYYNMAYNQLKWTLLSLNQAIELRVAQNVIFNIVKQNIILKN